MKLEVNSYLTTFGEKSSEIALRMVSTFKSIGKSLKLGGVSCEMLDHKDLFWSSRAMKCLSSSSGVPKSSRVA